MEVYKIESDSIRLDIPESPHFTSFYKALTHNYKIYMNQKLQRGELNGGFSI